MSGAKASTLMSAGIFLLLWGCGSPRYFDLQTDIPENRAGDRLGKVLLIEDAEINDTYRDCRIVCRESPFQVKYATFSSWSKTPDALIEDAVVLYWKQRAVFKKVDTAGNGDDPDWTMRIHVDAIERIQVQKKWYARLAMELEIVDSKNNDTLLTHSFDRKLPLEKNRVRLLPEKVSKILQEELLKIEAKLLKTIGTVREKSGDES